MRAIRANDGAIVKTIGDAVMAAFREPALAVRAALAVQHDAAAYNETAGEDGGPLVVKLGLHTGPCIAVTLNDRLDYFGSTVNLAARLEGQSRGGDIVLSEQVRDDPAVRALLAGTPSPLLAEAAEMKGFAGEIRYWRLPARAEAMQAAAAAGRSRAPGESVPNETPRRALREG
jgi:class 3 adenylate cyclase